MRFFFLGDGSDQPVYLATIINPRRVLFFLIIILSTIIVNGIDRKVVFRCLDRTLIAIKVDLLWLISLHLKKLVSFKQLWHSRFCVYAILILSFDFILDKMILRLILYSLLEFSAQTMKVKGNSFGFIVLDQLGKKLHLHIINILFLRSQLLQD